MTQQQLRQSVQMVLMWVPVLALGFIMYNISTDARYYMGSAVVLLTTVVIITGVNGNKFFIKVRTGYVCAVARTDDIIYYLLSPSDKAFILKMIDEELVNANNLFAGVQATPQTDQLKSNAISSLKKWRDEIKNGTVAANGILFQLTGYYWIGFNPFKTIVKSDLGVGPEYVLIITSISGVYEGIDVSGGASHQGSVPITVSAESEIMCFVDLRRIFRTETSTQDQISERLRAAVALLCSNRTVDELRGRVFNDPFINDSVTCDLISFGLLPGNNISVFDVNYANSPMRRVLEEQVTEAERERLLRLVQENAKIEAETAAQSLKIKTEAERARAIALAEAEAERIKLEGEAHVKILKDKIDAIGSDPNVIRSVLGGTEAGSLPTSVTTYAPISLPPATKP
jgi:hypothetical protein